MSTKYTLTKDQYQLYSGEEWPSYHEYLKGVVPLHLKHEIESYETIEGKNKQIMDAEIEEINRREFSTDKKAVLSYFKLTIFPALIGTVLYFYFGGTLLKFLLLFLVMRVLNMYNTLLLHRWLCHSEFDPKPWARPFLLWLLVAGYRVNISTWIKSHWAHHKDAETVLDPYPPQWGMTNLIFVGCRHYKRYPFGRWMVAPDIKFVLKNMRYLWIINTLIFALIDFDLILLGPLFIRFYGNIDNGISNFFLHDGFKSQKPVNYPIFGYFISLFVGLESAHEVHHNKPWIFNHARDIPDAVDIGYWMLKPFAAFER